MKKEILQGETKVVFKKTLLPISDEDSISILSADGKVYVFNMGLLIQYKNVPRPKRGWFDDGYERVVDKQYWVIKNIEVAELVKTKNQQNLKQQNETQKIKSRKSPKSKRSS